MAAILKKILFLGNVLLTFHACGRTPRTATFVEKRWMNIFVFWWERMVTSWSAHTSWYTCCCWTANLYQGAKIIRKMWGMAVQFNSILISNDKTSISGWLEGVVPRRRAWGFERRTLHLERKCLTIGGILLKNDISPMMLIKRKKDHFILRKLNLTIIRQDLPLQSRSWMNVNTNITLYLPPLSVYLFMRRKWWKIKR